ncbi:MAG: rhodanese-like domain-containing protein [Candidatus Sericytochromatia bacterium]|nr:rhodanese-like domain-containing protein [Candidatus Sericytochromatia bacterium]
MKFRLLLPILLLTACSSASAASHSSSNSSSASEAPKALSANQVAAPSRVDYPGFVDLSQEAGEYRKQRLVAIETFMKMAEDPQTMILDARSESAYRRKHIKGAININFSDFSVEGLKQAIPDKNKRILIYCNNNIEGDTANFPTKSVSLALNIPTFINLYGYGYKNVYELSSLLQADDARLKFEGTDVK